MGDIGGRGCLSIAIGLQVAIEKLAAIIDANPSKFVVVEAIGLPGSGKTHNVSRLLQLLQKKEVVFTEHNIDKVAETRTREILKKAAVILSTFLDLTRLLRPIFGVLRQFPSGSKLRRLKVAFNFFYIISIIINGKRSEGPLILDQGFFNLYGQYYFLQ